MSIERKRLNLAQKLRDLFLKMASDTDKSFIDPAQVVKGIVDESGKLIKIGDEEDIGEVSEKFLTCLDTDGTSFSGPSAGEKVRAPRREEEKA